MNHLIARSTKRQQLLHLLHLLKPYTTGRDLIRLGADSDGGYLVPDDLEGMNTCFSPGVDVNSSFELACAERGMEVYMADGSVEMPPISHPRFHFEKKYVCGYSKEGFLDFSEWVGINSSNCNDLMLQMDIEGFEYEVLYSMPQSIMKRFRVMVIEFHNLHRLFERSFFDLVLPMFEKINTSHVCVHMHPNNYHKIRKKNGIEIPRLAEFTFLRRDRITKISPIRMFPHPLDRDCTDKKSIVLPKCWYE